MELAGLAHKRTDDFCFGEKTGWIRRRNAEKNSYSLFQASFEWKDMSREAVLWAWLLDIRKSISTAGWQRC